MILKVWRNVMFSIRKSYELTSFSKMNLKSTEKILSHFEILQFIQQTKLSVDKCCPARRTVTCNCNQTPSTVPLPFVYLRNKISKYEIQ